MMLAALVLVLVQVLVGLYVLPPCYCFAPAIQNFASVASLSPSPLSLSLGRGHQHQGESSCSSCSANDEKSSSALRRHILFFLAAPSTLLLPTNTIDLANAAETPAEAVRLLTSKSIPGLGPPDIYFPSYFVGIWKVTSVITTSDDNFWNEMKLNGVNLPVTIVSKMRFVPYDAGKDFMNENEDTYPNNSNKNNIPVIADRAFNEKSYYAALSEELNRLYSTTKPTLPSIQSVTWTPTNPNVLSLVYANGSSKEVKVTKRSLDVSNDGNSIFSSEFRRITTVPPASSSESSISMGIGGIPSISKSRILTKWKQSSIADTDNINDVNRIEGIEIVYNENGTLGDKDRNVDPLLGGSSRSGVGSIPLPFGNDTKDLPDWRSTKTKIVMERIVG